MDTFAHAIWTYIIFLTTGNIWIAVFFGVMPDLLSWTIYLLYGITLGKIKEFKKPNFNKIPKWVHTLYGLTHSTFTVTVVFLIVFIIFKQIPLYLWAWPLHIAIDIPTHSRKMLPTPFLWPISKWTFPGFSWGQKWFMIINYLAIVIVSLIVFL